MSSITEEKKLAIINLLREGVEVDMKHTDRYGRTVAVVILPDGRNLNEAYAAIMLPDSIKLGGGVKGNIADDRRFLGTVSDELFVAHSRPSPETGLCLRPVPTADEGERIAA